MLDFLAGEFLHVAQRREVKRAATSARLPARIAPAARAVTAANVPDILQLDPLVAALPAAAVRDGRPRSKPGALQGDRANWLAPATRDWRRKASSRWWPTPQS